MNGKPRFTVLIAIALVLSACATNVVADKAMRFNQATAAYDAGDFPRAYQIWSELADEDDLAAMRNTAQMLRQGKGVVKDAEKAFDLYLEAAEKGLVTAMANVAEMYLSGEGTEKDEKEAWETAEAVTTFFIFYLITWRILPANTIASSSLHE